MKATGVLVVLASIFALASSAWGQSISGQNPVIHGEKITWPLAFEFNGSAPTIDVGNSSVVLNPPTFTVSAYVKFNDEMEQAMSSQRHLALLRTPVVLTYGSEETPEFQRQSRDFAAAVKAAGKPVELIEAAGYNHFEMGESLGHPFGPNGRAALAMMKLSLSAA